MLSDQDADEIMDSIIALAANPRPANSIKLDPPVRIFSALAERRLKIGFYRVFYDVHDERRKVYVYGIRRRDKDTYR
jgi:mRNA-degrading endonuclease RelE of RelBE toxin-antitoxin system